MRLYSIHLLGENAVKVENIDSVGVTVGRLKRKDSNDESCLSDVRRKDIFVIYL
jgi:hypothetical protein